MRPLLPVAALAALASIGLLGPPAFAAASPEGPSLAWAAVKMAVSLGLVLAILLLLSRFSRKYLERFAKRGGDGSSLAITEVRQAGLKAQIVVVEAYGARYLLGVTPTSISLIDKVPSGGPVGAA